MKFGEKDREWLLRKYYQPYREKVEMAVARMMQRGKPVLHLSIHSFTPVKNDTLRNADIGLLYDPARQCEKDLCTFLAKILKEEGVPLRVRKNYPYLGKTDGFASFFRTKYSAELYAGIEIETNQSLFSAVDAIKRFEDIFCRGIRIALKSHDFSTVESLLRLSRRRDGY
jgi:predicted N-formylglutamate amidohydrolase